MSEKPLSIDLLPCPFCRREAVPVERETEGAGLHLPSKWYAVRCSACYARIGEWESPERAAAEWNRRGYFGDRQEITEDWLRSVGFKWAQFNRQVEKQWLLWIGDGILGPDGKRKMFSGAEDLGVELGAHYQHHDGKKDDKPEYWSVFFRGDSAGIYHRFIHLRYIRYQDQVIQIVEALSGQQWNQENHMYGSLRTAEHAASLREDAQRLDQRMLRHPWTEAYKDADRAKPLPEHVDAAVKGGLAK